MAGILVVETVLLLILQGQSREGGGGVEEAENSREWAVGDNRGWSIVVMGWPNYKPFKAGDVLVFKYKAGQHNVVAMRDPVAYSLCCQFPLNATTYSSGDDRVILAHGMTFFLSTISDDCTNGMKMAVTAS
uniref:Phytocyanin domain-containing protein n=1 Tax=Leersia perrieri TaxID=77586 RepID=A0A0D9W3D3_9ORYZ